MDDMQSVSFVRELTAQAKRYAASQPSDQIHEVRVQLKQLNQRLSRMMDFSASLKDPGPALREIDELEQQRKVLSTRLPVWKENRIE
jgi:hypothetical protein